MPLSKRIPLEGTINTRDLGGYEGKDGKHISFKRILRTDDLSNLTSKDIAFLVKEYHPKWIIDLRSANETAKRPDKEIPGCRYVRLPFHENDIKMKDRHSIFNLSDQHLDHLIDFIFFMDFDGSVDKAMEKSNIEFFSTPKARESLRNFLSILKDNKERAVLFHCADGKDRTGFGAAFLLSLLGVSFEDIFKDYLMTNNNTKDKAMKRKEFLEANNFPNEDLKQGLIEIAGVKKNWLEAGVKEVERKYVNFERFAQTELDFTQQDLKELRNNYLR